MSDHPQTRRAPAPISTLPWLVALAGPVVVALETAVLLLVVGLVVGELVVRTRRRVRRAAESRAEVVQVRRLAVGASGIAMPPEDRALALALADQLGTVLTNASLA